MRILVVEDAKEYIWLYEEILSKCGLKYDIAENGIEALQLLKETEYSLVITDIIMPKISGIELILEMRKKQLQIPVIAVSSFGPALDECRRLGVYLTIAKPFNVSFLQDQILNVFKNRA